MGIIVNIEEARSKYRFWERQHKRSPHLDPLIIQPSWIAFRLKERPKPGFDKIPMTRNGGNMRDIEDENEHSSIREVVEQCCLKYPTHFHGAGFVFSTANRIVGIDIDYYKLNGQDATGQIINEVGERWPSLTTRTPSGGYHVYGYLDPLSATGRRLGSFRQNILNCIEIYNTYRYFAETLDVLPSRDVPLADLTEAITYLLDCHEALVGKLSQPVAIDDMAIATVAYESGEALIAAACIKNHAVRHELNTPHNKGDPVAWGTRLRNVVGDLRKAGGTWQLIEAVVLASPLVLASYDDGRWKSRPKKARYLLSRPSWRNRIDASNHQFSSRSEAAIAHGREVVLAWSNQK